MVVLVAGVEVPLLLILAEAGSVSLEAELVVVVLLGALFGPIALIVVVLVLEVLDWKKGFDSADALAGRPIRSAVTAPATTMRRRTVGRWGAVTVGTMLIASLASHGRLSYQQILDRGECLLQHLLCPSLGVDHTNALRL